MDQLWEDRDIRFDISLHQMKMRPGETLIDTFENVEDAKGNNGETGRIMVTNLRLIWHSNLLPRVNLSIGYNCVINVTTRNATSKLKGPSEALYISAKSSTKYEFVFSVEISGTPRLFTTVISVFKAYDTSKAYRNLKLRGPVLENNHLKLLPEEQVYNTINGAWNLSSDQGNLGTFYVTNIRVVWVANLTPTFNVSIPYLQIQAIRIRDSKFGYAMVIETSWQSGNYVLGFRIDPLEKLQEVAKEIQSLHRVYSANPIFGVQFKSCDIDDAEFDTNTISNTPAREETDLDESIKTDACVSYYADGVANDKTTGPPVLSKELGLAIEPLKAGYSISSLWKVL